MYTTQNKLLSEIPILSLPFYSKIRTFSLALMVVLKRRENVASAREKVRRKRERFID